MSLSFALGLPLSELRRMPLADLQQYQLYEQKHRLPTVRAERLLAQVALVMAQLQGVQNLSLLDCMTVLQPPPELPDEEPEPDPEQAAEQAAAALGYRPRKRKHTTDNRDTNNGQQPG